MRIELDHFLVPARDQRASAQLLAQLLDVPWAPSGIGPFSPVFVNEGLTLDFIDAGAARELTVHHYAFRVSEDEFDAILGRIKAARIPYRSNPGGPVDMQVNTQHGGRIVYWSEPDGHAWEILTESYAREDSVAAGVVRGGAAGR